MLSLKNSLKVLKKTKALQEGHFILSSGLHSPKYIQCAKLMSNPKDSSEFVNSLASKIKKKIKKIDIILAPAMGGIIIGYEIGRILGIETIFCERVKRKFKLRRDFFIKKNKKVLIVEDVITTGKSSLECVKLINQSKAKLVGFACLIDRSTNKKLKKKVISQIKLNIPTYSKKKIPGFLKRIPISKPGSRFLK